MGSLSTQHLRGIPLLYEPRRLRRLASYEPRRLRRLAIAFVLGMGSLVGLCPGTSRADMPPFSQAQARAVAAPPNEKPYDVRLHFLESNERRHDLFFSAVHNRGGAYLGVGADQNYTLAASADARLVFLIDIDGEVTELHRLYEALVPAAPTPVEFCALFDGKHGDQVANAIIARWGVVETRSLYQTYARSRSRLQTYLLRELNEKQNGTPVTWLSDVALYQKVRDLMIAHRVIARVGDLHGERTLPAIAQAARAAGETVRTVYLSNAEQWFRYSPQFTSNMAALPGDSGSIVLRTLARHELPTPPGDRWHFSVQPLSNFVTRLAAPQNGLALVQGLIGEMIQNDQTQAGARGLSYLNGASPLPGSPNAVTAMKTR